jgi:hypothetical protein
VDVLCASLSIDSTVNVQGVFLSIICSVDLQGISINSTCSVDVQGVSLFTASHVDVPGVTLSPACFMKVQGVSISSSSSVWMSKESSPQELWICRVHLCPTSAEHTSRVYSSLLLAVEKCRVYPSPPSYNAFAGMPDCTAYSQSGTGMNKKTNAGSSQVLV